jgi:predicted outer membrane protein
LRTLERLEARDVPNGTLDSPSFFSPFQQTGFLDDTTPAAVHLPTSVGTPGLAVNLLPVGSAAGGAPTVRVFNAATRAVVADLSPFGGGFRGGVHVAVGDVNGDGVADVITAAGPGGGPHVKVYDGQSLLAGNPSLVAGPLGDFFAYDPRFGGGVSVAAADLDGDNVADIITAAGAGGGPHVQAFSGRDGRRITSFYAYDPRFTGGVNVTAGRVTGDLMQIVTGAGPGGGPHVKVFNLSAGAANPAREFFAYADGFTGGVFVAAADLSGGGATSLITGAGAGGGPHVQVFNTDHTRAQSFYAFDSGFADGARLGVTNADASATANLLLSPGIGATAGGDDLGNFLCSNGAFAGTLQGARTDGLADLPFVLGASRSNQLEIALGELASQQGERDEVRDYGRHMVEDHSAAQAELQGLLADLGAGTPLPPSLGGRLPDAGDDTRRLAAELSGRRGRDFDRDYARVMVDSHADTVALYEAVAATGRNPDIRAFAQRHLPVLRQHLAEAIELRDLTP